MPAFLAQPLIKYGLMALAAIGVIAYILILRAERDAADARAESATSKLSMMIDDRDRQQAAVASRDQAISMLNGEVDRLRVDYIRADQIAANAAAVNRKAQEDLRQTQAALQEKARAHPDQVRPIGSVAAAFADGLQP